MKRRILIIVLAVFLCAYLAISLASRAALSQIETCLISYDRLISEYTVSCVVRGNRHACYFDGYVTAVLKQEGQRVEKDEVILKYTDSRGRAASLKADSDGWLLSVSGSPVILEDDELKLYGYLPRERYALVRTGQQGSFRINGRILLAEIEEKNDLAVEAGQLRECRLVFRPEEQAQLTSGQKVNVLLPLDQFYGLCVDSRALLIDEEGYYLLDAEAAEDLTRWKEHLIRVEVIAQSESRAIVTGSQLEEREVLILPDQYRKVLENAD